MRSRAKSVVFPLSISRSMSGNNLDATNCVVALSTNSPFIVDIKLDWIILLRSDHGSPIAYRRSLETKCSEQESTCHHRRSLISQQMRRYLWLCCLKCGSLYKECGMRGNVIFHHNCKALKWSEIECNVYILALGSSCSFLAKTGSLIRMKPPPSIKTVHHYSWQIKDWYISLMRNATNHNLSHFHIALGPYITTLCRTASWTSRYTDVHCEFAT